MAFVLPSTITRGLPADGPTASLAWTPSLVDKAQKAAMTLLGGVPATVLRPFAGRPVHREGQRLDTHFQLGVRFVDLIGHPELSVAGLPNSRKHTVADAFAVGGTPAPLESVTDISIPVHDASGADAGMVGARYYRPLPPPTGTTAASAEANAEATAELPLLLYFHGGGFVHGNLDSHDASCRYLAAHGEIAVLAVDYRLAPEHRFPTGLYDCLSAFQWAYDHAAELGVNKNKIAVGGDSAGGNLAAAVSLLARDSSGPMPAFQLLIVPVTQFGADTASRRTFAEGFYLTAAEMDFFEQQYLDSGHDPNDPLVSPLQAADLTGLPPAYVAVAGFDPLRDEGEAYAQRLMAAGVPTTLRRHRDAVHPFINTLGASDRSRAAVDEMIGALRQALAV